MLPSAPACMPVEIAAAQKSGGGEARVFRLAIEVAVDRLLLAGGLPDDPSWLHGELHLGFHLPGDPKEAIRCVARAEEIVVEVGTDREHASLRSLRLVALAPEAATRIESYVNERLLSA